MPKFAANLTMLFNDVDFLDRFAAAAAAGFAAVECQFPYDYDKDELARRLREYGLRLVLHNLPPGDWGAGERGIAILPDRVEAFREGVERAIDYATALSCPQVNCLAGIAPEGADPAPNHPFAEVREDAMQLNISPDGSVRCVYTETIDLAGLGRRRRR